MKNNILNIGWIGQGDFGDEVMAFILRKYLSSIGFNKITYYQHGKYPAYRTTNDLEISTIHRFDEPAWQKRWLDIALLRKYNILIIGGGSVLHSYNSIAWKLAVINKIKNNHKKSLIACVGVSVGPLETNKEKNICTDLLNKTDITLVRDDHSAILAKSLANQVEIYASLDSSLLLPLIATDELKLAKIVKKEDDLVGVMFIKKKGEEELFMREKFLDKFQSIIDKIISNGKRVMLFNLYIGDDYPDIELNGLLKNNSKYKDKIEIYTFNGDIFETIKEIGRCDHIISMRLHGIIFSYLLGIPFLSLGYNEKNKNFCGSINYPSEMALDFYSLNNLDQVYSAIDKLFKRGTNLFQNTIPVTTASQKVKDNFDKLKDKLANFL
jgi:polysaccharide pyruvyl transferase WcaK-like protein